MREIKFREWDTERKTMSYGEREDFDDMVGFRFAHEEYGKRILMQYTGLKDKNGVEIWEGDVVRGRIYYMFAEDNVIFQIRWSDQEKGYGIHWYPNEVEVIGNAFENPELSGEMH